MNQVYGFGAFILSLTTVVCGIAGIWSTAFLIAGFFTGIPAVTLCTLGALHDLERHTK